MKSYLVTLFLLLFLAAGCKGGKISGDEEVKKADKPDSSLKTITARYFETDQEYEAVGTIRPKTETRIESQIQAQVRKVLLSPGAKVKKGDLLVLLDDRSANARLNQAKEALKRAKSLENQSKQGVESAKAGFKQALSDYERVKKYFETQAATKSRLERVESAYLQAKAGLKRAKDVLESAGSGIRAAMEKVSEAELGFEYTRITAPDSGEVLKRMVEPGDLALPGKPLLIIQTSGMLRIEAHVREGLISYVKTGDQVKVSLKRPERELNGTIEEIVPYADPNTRTFLVKAAIPYVKGVYPGMYGKILIPLGKKKTILVPDSSIISIGQLDMVNLKTDKGFKRVYVKTGSSENNMTEVLSGLNPGDVIEVKEVLNVFE